MKKINDMSAGTISPKVSCREDLPLLYKSSERSHNWLPMSQGPSRFRNGSIFVNEGTQTVEGANTPHLLPFVFNDAQSYILEWSAETLKVLNSNGLITATPLDVTSAAEITPVKPSYVFIEIGVGAAHGIVANQYVLLAGFVSSQNVNGLWRVASVTSTTIKIQTSYIGNITFSDFSNATVQKQLTISTPYVEADFPYIQVAQINDVMYIVHPDYPPAKLTRSSETSWTYDSVDFTADPFDTGNYPGAVAFHNQRLYFGGSNEHPGRVWGSRTGNYEDFTMDDGGDVLATHAVQFDVSSNRYTTVRSLRSTEKFMVILCSDGNFKANGGGDETPISPTSINCKQIDSHGAAYIMPALVDKSVIYVQKDLRRVRAIEYSYENSGYSSTDLTKAADHVTLGGVRQIAYQDGLQDVLWVLREDGVLAGLNYDLQENIVGWHTHSTRDGDIIKSIAVRPIDEGFGELWLLVRRQIDGVATNIIERVSFAVDLKTQDDFYTGPSNRASDMEDFLWYMFEAQRNKIHLDSSVSYDGSEQIRNLTLSALSGATITVTASGALFAGTDIGREIWAKGAPGRLEIIAYSSSTVVTAKVTVPFTALAITAGNYYLTTDVVSGIPHLEGETVTMIADGAYHTPTEVISSQAQLQYQAGVVHVGLEYMGVLKIPNLSMSQHKKGVHKAHLRLKDALGIEIGTDPYSLEKIPFRETKDLLNRPPPLFSGYMEVNLPDSSAEDKFVYIVQRRPHPCMVQMVTVEFNEGGS